MSLTIVIPTRNEGPEIVETVNDLHMKSITSPEIIVVNDWTDGDKWFKPSGCTVIKPRPFAGFGGAIQAGIDASNSDNIYICGARTRFTRGWDQKVINHIEAEPETIFCPANKKLTYDQKLMEKSDMLFFGAYIIYFSDTHWFKWLINYPVVDEPEGDEVSCAYGGSYAMKKSWWEKIRGLDMIQTRGGCNQFLSLKTWMAGGKVKVMKDVINGNVYRKHCSYQVNKVDLLYNRMMIMYVLYGKELALDVIKSYQHYRDYPFLKKWFGQDNDKISDYHEYMKDIKKGSINQQLKMN